MRQARWTESGLAVAEVLPPPLPAGWVRLSVAACGICGTDLHLWRRELPPPLGIAPGHEISGTVLEGPAGLADALYAVEPIHVCGQCDFCVSGRRQLCAQLEIFGVMRPGGLADFVDVPREAIHPVHSSVSPLVASLAEPLAVCERAVSLARLDGDSRVLVLGAGSIGLLAGLLARDRAGAVAISARHSQQRESAKRLGLLPLAEGEVRAWAADAQPDVVIETVGGQAQTLLDATRFCRAGGRIVVLGIFSKRSEINGYLLATRELELVGSNMYGMGRRGPQFRAAVELLPRVAAEIAPLQTHRFALAQLDAAFAAAGDKHSGAIKVTVLPGATGSP
ncbi:MAG TPA: alcohol dehydrogenase catalytic domain-containing protein [Myxococcota bacterium]|nr:alcohol dehydrogenase catalytic domain-containing protein [Myxococcota bacterium]